MKRTSALALACMVAANASFAAERIDYEMLSRIRTEGFRNSKVMETARTLTDKLGPRLTGSPQMTAANEWTRKQLEEWGLSNAHLEKWGPFGRGWSYDRVSTRMVAPQVATLYAIPKAWTPGTSGAIRGQVVRVKLSNAQELEAQKGKLAGKIVMIGDMPDLKPHEKGTLERHNEETLRKLEDYQIPAAPSRNMEEFARRRGFRNTFNKFAMDEKILAIIEPGSGGDSGTFDVSQGGAYKADEPVGVPQVVMNPEHYGRVARLLEAKENVELELEVDAKFNENEGGMAFNTIAEIPGTDKKNEVVMLGAHLDSWHSGTGATDNAAGSAAMMEAIRILKALDIKPRRTIRIALWSGEEQGLLGSRGYVSDHFGAREEPRDQAERDTPAFARTRVTPLVTKPEYPRFSVYFNMDNGTGRIRGIYAQENLAAVPIFEQWIAPLRDLGVTTVATRNTGGTDHQSFDGIGLPGFQFIQDQVEYGRTHHSSADTYERLQREDMMQAAVVIATFVYNAAMRDELFPRKPLPKTDPPSPAPAAAATAGRGK